MIIPTFEASQKSIFAILTLRLIFAARLQEKPRALSGGTLKIKLTARIKKTF